MKIKAEHFSPDPIALSGQCFRWRKLGEGKYEIPAFDRSVVICLEGDCLSLSCSEEEYRSVWRSYFDLDTDYARMDERALSLGDGFLREALLEEPGVRILRQDFWETLISFLISQNNNIPRIKKSIEKLCGGEVHFPGPEEILDMDLSEMGLGYRDSYLKSAASWFLSVNKDVSRVISGNEDISRIRGVGPKVLSCVRLYGMHRMDECPIDTWMKKLIHEVYEDRLPEWINDPSAGYFQQLCFMKIRKDSRTRNGSA